MKTILVVFAMLLTFGCVAPPSAPASRPAACPPLPHLPPGATRKEGRVHWLTVIALYEQCAESKR